MDDLQARLTNCFLGAFPDLQETDVPGATLDTVKGWDSLANITLLTVIEEEFGISVDASALTEFTSFQATFAYLERKLASKANG
jgi:acyl carrier protein